MDGGSGSGRISAAAKRLSAPRSLKATSVAWGGVTLKWTAPKGAKPTYYVVLRDGKSLGKTTRTSFTDRRSSRADLPLQRPRARRAQARGRAVAQRAREGAQKKGARRRRPRRRRRTRRRRSPRSRRRPSRPPRRRRQPPRRPLRPRPPPPRLRRRPTSSPRRWSTGCSGARASARRRRSATRGRARTHAELVDWFLNTPSALEPTTHAAADADGAADRPARLRHRARARVDRPHAARDQPAAGPAGVLLAPPLGDQPRRRHPDYPWVINYRNRLLKYADFGATRTRRSASSRTR